MSVILYTFGSVILVSLISVIAAIPLLLKKKFSQKLLLTLLSLAVGTLLGGVFIHFIPEAIEHGYNTEIGLTIIAGFLVFLVLEKFIHLHHDHSNIHGVEKEMHHHAYHIAPINLIGDAMHNFIDGMIIASSYLVSIPLGIAATISVIFHEIPQEIADFGVLLYSGLTKSKALLFNLLSATAAIIGAIVALILSSRIESFTSFIIPFAAGNFLYIAASNLVPELHQHCKFWDTVVHASAIMFGVALMAALTLLEFS
jgi:zinc and cadmium transporter